MVKCTWRGLVVKRPGVLSKVQMLSLVLGVGVFSLLAILAPRDTFLHSHECQQLSSGLLSVSSASDIVNDNELPGVQL